MPACVSRPPAKKGTYLAALGPVWESLDHWSPPDLTPREQHDGGGPGGGSTWRWADRPIGSLGQVSTQMGEGGWVGRK